MAEGAPIEMRDANGNSLELKRDRHRNLKEIKTPHGHWIKFNYDDLCIKRAETDAGDWAQYEYNSDGMLINVVLSSGRQRRYDYQGMLMTEVRDEAGRVLIHNWYEGDLLKRQAFGNGAVYSTATIGLQVAIILRRSGHLARIKQRRSCRLGTRFRISSGTTIDKTD